MDSTLSLNASLGALLIRADGTHREISDLSKGSLDINTANNKLRNAIPWYKRLFTDEHGLVTTTGINYLAADFLSASSNRINAFNFSDCGTGVTAAAISDTALQTAAGTARVSGTQTTTSAGQYRTVATISFTSTLAITEYGLFSASTTGTMWDHRVFSAINVANGDSVAFTYNLTCVAGGS
jgi:hypothetical protein